MAHSSNHPFQLRTGAFLAAVNSKEAIKRSASHQPLRLPANFQFSTRLRAVPLKSSASTPSISTKQKEAVWPVSTIPKRAASTESQPKHENWKRLGISREEYYAMGQDEHYDNYDFDNYVETETDRMIFADFYEHSRRCFAALGYDVPSEEDNPFNFD